MWNQMNALVRCASQSWSEFKFTEGASRSTTEVAQIRTEDPSSHRPLSAPPHHLPLGTPSQRQLGTSLVVEEGGYQGWLKRRACYPNSPLLLLCKGFRPSPSIAKGALCGRVYLIVVAEFRQAAKADRGWVERIMEPIHGHQRSTANVSALSATDERLPQGMSIWHTNPLR